MEDGRNTSSLCLEGEATGTAGRNAACGELFS